MPKQRNCRARAKRKIKVLRLKKFRRRTMERKLERIAKASKPKGITITGRAREHAEKVLWDEKQSGKMFRLNQRQKRKLWRQVPHMRQRA